MIYNDPEIISDELTSLKLSNVTKSNGTFQTVLYLLGQYSPALVVVIMISVFDGLCGGSIFYSYFPSMLQTYTTIPTIVTLQYNVYLAIIRVITTCYAVSRLDSVNGGRRLLLLRGVSLILIGQLCMAVVFFKDCNSDTAALHCWQSVNALFIISSGMVVIGQAIGFSIVLHLLQTEMFPTVIRSRAMGISLIIQNISLFTINVTFLPITNRYNIQIIFICYSLCALIGFLLIYFKLPETRNTKPLDILNLLLHKDVSPTELLNKKGAAVVINRSANGNNAYSSHASTSLPISINNPIINAGNYSSANQPYISNSPLPVVTLYPHIISPSNSAMNYANYDERMTSNSTTTTSSNFVMNIAYQDNNRNSIG